MQSLCLKFVFQALILFAVAFVAASCHEQPAHKQATVQRLKAVYYRVHQVETNAGGNIADYLKSYPGESLQKKFQHMIAASARTNEEEEQLVIKMECYDDYGEPFNVDFRTNLSAHGAAPIILSIKEDLIIWSSGPNRTNEFGYGDDIVIDGSRQ